MSLNKNELFFKMFKGGKDNSILSIKMFSIYSEQSFFFFALREIGLECQIESGEILFEEENKNEMKYLALNTSN